MKTTRRKILAAGTSALATAGQVCGEDPASPGWIDAHVHVWTPDTKKYPNAKGRNRKGLRKSYTPEELFADCRPHGVSRIVLIQMSFYGHDNSYMLDMIRQHKGVFAGVAILDEKGKGLSRSMYGLAQQGVQGFRVYANAKNAAAWEKSNDMKKMWREAAKFGQSICCLADPDALPSISKLCQANPETPVVIDHFARIGMRGEVDQKQLDQLLKLSEFPHTTVKVSAFYALGAKSPPYEDLAPMIRQLRDAYGADRLMWASDCPFQSEAPHTYEASISLIRDRLDFLCKEEKTAILRGTAERVFF